MCQRFDIFYLHRTAVCPIIANTTWSGFSALVWSSLSRPLNSLRSIIANIPSSSLPMISFLAVNSWNDRNSMLCDTTFDNISSFPFVLLYTTASLHPVSDMLQSMVRHNYTGSFSKITTDCNPRVVFSFMLASLRIDRITPSRSFLIPPT